MIEGIWGNYENELGSKMIIKPTTDSHFEGIYQTAVGVPELEHKFKLFGTFIDCKTYVLLSWTVNWQQKTNSITAWIGAATCDKEGIKIVTNYHLNRAHDDPKDSWLLATSIAGQNIFKKTQ